MVARARVGGSGAVGPHADVRQAVHRVEAPLVFGLLDHVLDQDLRSRINHQGIRQDHRRYVEVRRGVRAVEAEFAVVGPRQ